MKKEIVILWISLLTVGHAAVAQFYYKDILSTEQAGAQFAAAFEKGIRKISISSFNSKGEPEQAFTGTQELDSKKKRVKTYLQIDQNRSSWLISQLNQEGKLIGSVDSSENLLNKVTYEFNEQTQLRKVVTRMTTSNRDSTEEIHIWNYSNQLPTSLTVLTATADTTEVSFVILKEGLIGEEIWRKKGVITERYFYYYNDQKKLTDIVRYNQRAGRLLPDYLFQYDEKGRLFEMITVNNSSADYQIWRYEYGENGLKTKEICYNKQKKLLGWVVFTHEL
jgi:hypothetical protein